VVDCVERTSGLGLTNRFIFSISSSMVALRPVPTI
jgi:hypothetical protein